MKIQIKARFSSDILFEGEFSSMKEAVQEAAYKKAHLRGADLREADLREANLYGADLSGANLYGANLYGADLSGANLRGANLYGANLYGADLSGANLREANLRGALNIPPLAAAQTVILPEGDLIGWKKAGGHIVKLRIPAEARRSNATGRKCRAEYAEVLEIEGAKEATSERGGVYRVGETVRPDSWDDDRWNECSHGIHFFITREEADAWTL